MRGGEILKGTKRFFCVAVALLLTIFTLISYLPVKTASAKTSVPEIEFANPPVTQYTAGDRVNFNIYAPNYGGRVQYRVVLWNDSKKTYYDLWNASNGYPNRYYTKWQPYGNNIFTLGWIIFEPGSYRITVYAKRAGIANNKTALKGLNCDSYMESMAFYVKSKEAAVESILPLSDVTVMQGATPTLPSKVKAAMSDGLMKELGVTWPSVNTLNPGTQTIQGTVEGTTKKASIKVIVTAQSAINVYSVTSINNYLVNVTLRDAISSTPEASKFSIKSYNSSVTVPIQSVSLSSDKKTVTLTTAYMTTNSWYTLTVNNNSYNFIANQGNGNGISLAAQNKEVAVGSTVYASVTKYPSDVTLSYYSSNTTIATVDQYTGLITGRYPGVATITVYGDKSGYTRATTTFTVTVGGQSGMYVYAQNMEIGIGTQQYPVITKYPQDMTLYFSSSNSNIATVDYYSGLVTGVSPGTATITIYANKAGYATGINTTFTVTVGSQSSAITAYPERLYESSANDGTLASGDINVVLTSGQFNWIISKPYVLVSGLPAGMSYAVTQITNNTIRVTLTGAAYAHENINDTYISITVLKEAVYGATYNLTTNRVLLDFMAGGNPAAPTNPVVNDVANTFGWTPVPGYYSFSDYEYSVDGGAHFADCTANPQYVGNYAYAAGAVQVRVKASTSNGWQAGTALVSDRPFTKDTVADTTAPALGNLNIDFNSGDPILTMFMSGEVSISVHKGRKLSALSIQARDDNLLKNDVTMYKLSGSQSSALGVLKYNESAGLWNLGVNSAAQNLFDTAGTFRLKARFSDTFGNYTDAIINVTVSDITITSIDELKPTIVQGNEYTLPTTVPARMSDGNTRDVNVAWGTWNPELDTNTPGEYKIEGTVEGYDGKAILTLTVTPRPVIQSIDNITKTINVGETYTPPSKVSALMSNGNYELVDITWVWDLPLDTSKPGVYTAQGTVTGYDPKVILTLTVAAPPPQ